MDITYTWQITKINAERKSFNVAYHTENRPTVEVEIPHPYEGDENLHYLIQRHSPVMVWVNETRKLDPDVVVGATATVTAHFAFD